MRSSIQLGILTAIILLIVFFLDNRFGVLPDAIHNALPAHHPGFVITDIDVATCSSLNPLSSCKLDAGKWHRINTDLYLSRGWLQHAYVHIQRKRESELSDVDRVILDVRVGQLDPGKNHGSERWESRRGGIWLKRASKRHASDFAKAVTAVGVLFGLDAVEPRPGWHLSNQPLLLNAGDNHEAHLTIQRGPPIHVEKPVLRVRKDGKFKILQVADLHFSTGTGVCRDPGPPSLDGSGKCEADPRTLALIHATLDLEKPDLVVLSGDQVNGETSPHAQSAVFKFANIFIQRKIPYATIFGNHDNEGDIVSREALMELIQPLPYSLAEPGPTNVDGVGNYYIEILGRGTSSHSALTLYFLDTHSYSPDEHHFPGYDWLKNSQIDWFKSTAKGLRLSHAQYTHVHMDMAFIHIPLPEYRNVADIVPSSGSFLENPTAPSFNSGFKSALVEAGILAVSCGHDHVNDYCTLAKGDVGDGDAANGGKPELWMCYAGGSGFGGYGGYGGYQRRVRVFDFDMNVARIRTWKRVEGGGDGKIVTEKEKMMGSNHVNTTSVDGRADELTLVEGGKVVST